MLCSLRWALPLVMLIASMALAQPPVPPPVPPFAPQAQNVSPLPPAFPTAAPQVIPTPPPTAPNAMEMSKPFAPPNRIGNRSLTEWLVDFKSSDPTVREQATRVVQLFGIPAARSQAIKPLIGMFDDPDPGVRINAILVTSSIGFDKLEDAKAASDKLTSVLGKTLPGSVIRLHATRALAGIGREAFGAINAVVAVAEDPSWEIRAAAATTLGRIGGIAFEDKAIQTTASPNLIPIVKRPPSKAAMDRLNLHLIRDKSATVRMEACHSLVLLGPPYSADPNGYPALAKPYIDVISARVKGLETDPTVKVWLMLLHIMYDDRVFNTTLKSMGGLVTATDPQLQVQALNALAVLGPKAKPVMNTIMTALFHDEPMVAAAAITTVMSMGDEARAAQPELERLVLTTKNADLKKFAENAVAALKNDRRPAAPIAPAALPAKKP